jgi:hypothetical protein
VLARSVPFNITVVVNPSRRIIANDITLELLPIIAKCLDISSLLSNQSMLDCVVVPEVLADDGTIK